MLYAFILGRVFTLSLAEVLNVLQKENITFRLKTVASEIALIETEEKINAKKLQSLLGGTIKIVEIVDSLNRKQKDTVGDLLTEYLDFKTLRDKYLAANTGKTQIGVSIYIMDSEAHVHFTEPKQIAMLIKKYLQSHDISVRFVMPEAPSTNLPSVVVTKNMLLEKGAEFVILLGRQNLSIGKTLSVQDFEDYGRRDYQRPFRDPKMGMLPPKVAQIMLNLSGAKKGETVIDPFCGGATMLQEALLMGLNAIGSDINEHTVRGAESNLLWFRNRYNIPPGRFQVLKLDATTDLEREFGNKAISAVVTEGWLGPIYSEFPKEADMKENFKNLLTVYIGAFQQFKNILKPGAKIVISLPAYRRDKDRYVFFPSLDFINELGYSVEDPLPPEIVSKYPFLKVTDRKSMIYDRKDQIVAREILVINNN